MARLHAGLTRKATADTLRVSERTVRNWEAGRAAVPYSAFKLLCIMGGELPGDHWRGFVLRGDTLWSPEGKAFTCYELAYWGLTCEIARTHLQSVGIASALPAAPGVVRAMTSQQQLAVAQGLASLQPVTDATAARLGAADRRQASPVPVRSDCPSLQNRSLPADQAGVNLAPLLPFNRLVLPASAREGHDRAAG